MSFLLQYNCVEIVVSCDFSVLLCIYYYYDYSRTPQFQHQPPRGTADEAVNSRQSSCGGCGSRHLEQTTT